MSRLWSGDTALRYCGTAQLTSCLGLGAKIQVIHITRTAGLGGLDGFGAHILAAAIACGINGVLAIMLALSNCALACGLGQVLAHFSTRQGRFETGIRCDKFGLLGES